MEWSGGPPTGGAPPPAGNQTTELDLQPGDVLVREGDPGHDVYEVISGSLAVLRGGTARIDTIGPGETVGEIAALAGTIRTATVQAIAPTVVRRLPSAAGGPRAADDERLAELSELARTRIDRHRAIDIVQRLLDVTPADAAAVVGLADWVHLTGGDVLFREGDEADAGYLLISGRLCVTVGDEPIGEVARGEIVGEMGLIERAPRSATVTALRDCALARFDREAFQRLTASHPTIMTQLTRTIVARIGRAGKETDRARNIAVAVVAPIDRRRFVSLVVDELEAHGTTKHLWAARVDADLRHPGLTQTEPPAAVPAIVEYIEEAETAHDYVVFEADGDRTRWTRRSVTLADRIVVVMSSAPDHDELLRAEKIFTAGPRRARVERWLALVQSASTERPSGTAQWVDRLGADRVVHVREGGDADVRRLARLVSGNATALVLGGGGARGFAHLGVWQALEELGVPVDVIAGASIGAPLGAGMALQIPAREMTALAAGLFHGLLDYTVPVVSLIKGERVTRNIASQLGDLDILDLWLPFLCVSTNLTWSRVQVHDRGPLATAVRASVALPGILPPVPYDGDLLVDGGVLNNLPCDVVSATRMVATTIAVDLSPPVGPRAKDDFGLSVSGWKALRSRVVPGSSPYPGLMPVLMRSMITASVRDRDRVLAEGRVDCYLDLHLGGVNLLDFERVEEVAQRGYADARPRLEAWLEGR